MAHVWLVILLAVYVVALVRIVRSADGQLQYRHGATYRAGGWNK